MSFKSENLNRSKALALCAQSQNDLDIISALVQDSILIKQNIRWNKKRRRFTLLINRFRWEFSSHKKQKTIPYKRVQAVLIFDGVLNALAKNIKHALDNEVLALLNINLTRNESFYKLELIFSGKACIMLETELLHVLLKDLEDNHIAGKATVPEHKI